MISLIAVFVSHFGSRSSCLSHARFYLDIHAFYKTQEEVSLKRLRLPVCSVKVFTRLAHEGTVTDATWCHK